MGGLAEVLAEHDQNFRKYDYVPSGNLTNPSGLE